MTSPDPASTRVPRAGGVIKEERRASGIAAGAPTGVVRWSTEGLGGPEALDAWFDVVCSTFSRYSLRPLERNGYYGTFSRMDFGEFAISVVDSVGQTLFRNRRLIELDGKETFSMGYLTRGRFKVEQDQKAVSLGVADLSFSVSTRPRTMAFDQPFTLVIVEFPLSVAKNLISTTIRESSTAVPYPRAGGMGLLTSYVGSLITLAETDPVAARRLGAPLPDMLAASVCLLHDTRARPEAYDALAHENVLAFLRANLSNPRLTADTIAAACHLSRRTLYRLFEGPDAQGVAATLRSMRVRRAKTLLTSQPTMSVNAVAHACGFSGEVQFHRVFRTATAMTPSEFRSQALATGYQVAR